LSYLTQKVFIFLIHNGFCGQDDKDDEENKEQEEEDNKFFEQDGCGMGDGKGQENVSKEIEDEEQLEGLQEFDSDQE